MQYMSYMIQYFYTVLASNRFDQPNFTDLFRIAESIMYKNPIVNKKHIDRLSELNNKLDGIDLSIPEVELIFFKNAQKGINAEIEIKGDTYTMGELFSKINDVIKELTRMISEVAYSYDVDIPLGRKVGGGVIEW